MRKSFPVKALVLSAPTDVKLQFWRPGMRRPSSNAGNPTVFIILAMMLGLAACSASGPSGPPVSRHASSYSCALGDKSTGRGKIGRKFLNQTPW
jgi:hypothetical protein